MSEQWYFGQVEYEPQPHTRVTCIAKAIDGSWKKQDFEQELPPIGKIFAPSLAWSSKGQFIIFTSVTNPKINEKDSHLDRYIISEAHAPTVVIDCRHLSAEQIRYKLVQYGLGSIDGIDSQPNEVIVALSNTECAIVEVKPDSSNGRYVAKTKVVEVRSFNSAIFDGDTFQGQFIEIPDVTVGDFIREITWKLDVDILHDLLDKLKNYDDYLKTTTRKQRDDLVSLLDRSLNIVEQEEWSDTYEWLDSYKQRVTKSLIDPKQVIDTLSNMQPFQQGLELSKQAIINSYRQEIKPIVEKEVREGLADLLVEQEKLTGDIQDKHEELAKQTGLEDDLKQKISNLSQQLVSEIGKLNQTLGDLKELDSEENISLVARFKKALEDKGRLINPINSTSPPWIRDVDRNEVHYIDSSEVLVKLQALKDETAISLVELLTFDIAIRSGDLVILPSISAEILMPKYAGIITGNVIFRETLGPNILNLNDLWVQPNQGIKTGFAKAWSMALANPNQYQLVWLDGLQRTAIDLWLPSLVGVLHGSARPSNLLVMATIDDNFIDLDRLWSQLPNFSTPIVFENQDKHNSAMLRQLLDIKTNSTQLTYQKVSTSSADYSEIFEKGQLWLKELLNR
jgi:hypothetical protein